MELDDVMAQVREGAQNRVFGDPYERDGVTVIPVAAARARGGGGRGTNAEGGGHGWGGGFVVTARPVGAFVLRDGQVTWQPAIDATRLAIGGQLMALAVLLVIRSILKKRRRR